jgi:hypothetical protein
MDDAVEDGVDEGGIVEVGVPVLDRQLAGDQGGFTGGAIVEQFEQVVAFGLAVGREAGVQSRGVQSRRIVGNRATPRWPRRAILCIAGIFWATSQPSVAVAIAAGSMECNISPVLSTTYIALTA